MSQQLVKKGTNGKHENVMPKSWIEAIKDKYTGQSLLEILQGFNMYFLSYNGDIEETRNMVPTNLRKKGLWITYVKYDGNVYTEWYASSKIDDKSWGDSSNWRIGNNTLVGDITISANGNWVINGTETEFKAVGEKGNTPLIRVANNRLQVSYDLGDTYMNVTENPVYTQFRWYAESENIGRIQASTDNGTTWTNMSNDFTNNLHISKYIGVNESLPTSGIAEGTIYAKGPYYAEDDTLNDNPIYRLWVYAWKGNTLAWQDNGEFQSIAAGIVQETGDNENAVMSQKAVTNKLSELDANLYKKEDIIFPNSNTFITAGSGTIENGSNYSTSNFIDITYVEKIVIKLRTTTDVTTLAYYSTNNVSGYISDIGSTTMNNIVVVKKSDFPANAKYIKLCKRDDYSVGGYAYSLSNIYEQYHDELDLALSAEVERATGAEGDLQTNITNLANKTIHSTEQSLSDIQIERVLANLGISAIDTTVYNKTIPTFISGKFIVKNTGTVENGGTFDATDFISIKDVSAIELQVRTNESATSLAYYSTNDVSGYISDIGNTLRADLHIIRATDFPQGANYVRICKRNDYEYRVVLYSCPFQKNNSLFYDVEVSNFHNSKFINKSNGNIENGSDFSVTDSYLVENIEYIKLFIGTQGTAAPLAFYDKNGNFISAIDNITKSQNFIAYKQDFPSNTYSIRMGKRDSISTGGSITITYKKASDPTEWKHRIMAAYGDSVTAICNGDFSNPFKTDFNYGWGQRAARFFDMSAFYGRGIGGQNFCWITNGGSLSWVNKTTGKYVGRDDTHTYEDYINNPSIVPTVSDGGAYNADTCYFVRGAGCSWQRIIKMFPESIKDSIDVITIMFHNDASVGDAALNADLTWVDNSVIDTEWANSSYYSTYGGDYNINTVKGGIASIVMKIQAWMPKVRIVLMTPISGRGGSSGQLNKNLTDYNMQKLAENVRDMHKLMSVPLVDMYATCGINGLNRNHYIADSIHPYTENGGKAIAGALVGGLKGITPFMNVFG